MAKKYVQCILRKDNGSTIHSWINKRGARKGNRLKLTDTEDKDFWNVIEVFGHTILTEKEMLANRDKHREGLASIR